MIGRQERRLRARKVYRMNRKSSSDYEINLGIEIIRVKELNSSVKRKSLGWILKMSRLCSVYKRHTSIVRTQNC